MLFYIERILHFLVLRLFDLKGELSNRLWSSISHHFFYVKVIKDMILSFENDNQLCKKRHFFMDSVLKKMLVYFYKQSMIHTTREQMHLFSRQIIHRNRCLTG